MARRSRSTATTDEAPVTEAVTEATEEAPEMSTDVHTDPFAVPTDESPVTEPTAVESTEPVDEKPVDEKPADEKPKPAEVDLTDFQAAVSTAVGARDTSTGTIDEANIQAVQAAYRALEGNKAKSAAKKHINEQLKSAINAMDIVQGKAIMSLNEALATAGSTAKAAAERTPTDPTDAFVQRLSTLHLAYALAAEDVPEGVNAEEAIAKVEERVAALEGQAATYNTWVKGDPETRGDEPTDIDATVKKAVKMAQGKVVSTGRATGGSTSGGPRRDMAKHIQEAFADQPEGTFLKIAEISNFKSSEYPEGNASAGAVSARLFPASGKMTVAGVEPGENEDGKRGARKIAA